MVLNKTTLHEMSSVIDLINDFLRWLAKCTIHFTVIEQSPKAWVTSSHHTRSV